jgi:hypothetical protein
MLEFWIILDGFGLSGVGLDWIRCQRLIIRIGLDLCLALVGLQLDSHDWILDVNPILGIPSHEKYSPHI